MAEEGEGDPSALFKAIMSNVSPTKYKNYKRNKPSEVVSTEDDSALDDDTTDLMDFLESSTCSSLSIGRNSTEVQLRNFVDGRTTFNELASVMNADSNDDDTSTTVSQTGEPQPGTSQEDFDDIFPQSRKKRGGGGKRSKLDRHSQSLIGSANLAFARGNTEDAIKMCLEVVRENPKAHEPYSTLGDFYEELNDFGKAFQYHMIAAFLCPNDFEGWIKVAEMASEQNDPKSALLCYNKAVRLNSSDISLKLERSKIQEILGDSKKALSGFEEVLRLWGDEDGEGAIRLATKIATLHFENKNCPASIEILENAFQKYESDIVSENINTYIELLITEKLFTKALQAFRNYCGVEFLLGSANVVCDESLLSEDTIGLNASELRVELPFDIPIDLRSKLIVCLIYLRCNESLKDLQEVIEKENPEETGDLYLDLADAYMDVGSYSSAEPFLRKLVATQNYDLPAVWLRYARCLKEVREDERSITAFYKVLAFAPNHHDARLELSDLLLALNRSREATEVSSQTESDQVNLDLLLVRSRLLYEQRRADPGTDARSGGNQESQEFVKTARLLLLSDMLYLTHTKEISCMISSSSHRTRLETLRDVHKELGIDANSHRANYVGKEVAVEELFSIYMKLVRVLCFETRDFAELERIVFSAYTCTSFADRDAQLDFIALMCMYLSENKENVYKLFKAVVGRNPANHQVWNVFCPIMSRFYQDLRHNRFCLRLFVKHPDLLPLAYFNGHNALMSGSYKHALAEYVSIQKQHPKDPFAGLCVALGFLHLACQKFISNKNSVVIQLTAFLDLYMKLRGECQESLYNVGRAFQQLGLQHNAIHFYKRALDCATNIETSEESRERFSLAHEIGYNLSLIYRASGATELALDCLRKYCVV